MYSRYLELARDWGNLFELFEIKKTRNECEMSKKPELSIRDRGEYEIAGVRDSREFEIFESRYGEIHSRQCISLTSVVHVCFQWIVYYKAKKNSSNVPPIKSGILSEIHPLPPTNMKKRNILMQYLIPNTNFVL